MKKHLFLVIAGLMILNCGIAQERRLTALLGYGTQIENIGLGVGAELPIGDTKLVAAPSFVYYFAKEQYSIKTSIWEINANVNYHFFSNGNVSVYGLAGLNYTQVKVKADLAYFGEMSASDGKIGLNIGAGVNFDLGKSFLPFAELKYAISDFDQLLLAAGVKINL